MPSPFPGFDPFLEDQGYWQEVHTSYIVWMQYALVERLPDAYEVRIEERLSLAYEGDDLSGRDIQPDAAILRSTRRSRPALPPSFTATLEPVLLTLPRHRVEEVVEKRLAIRHFPGRDLVTAIELLSPSNKRAPGDSLYDQKRQELIDQEVNLVELDLLNKGGRLPMVEDLPAGHYYAFVSRAEDRPFCATYAWTIRDPLPGIPIPLKAPDPDVILDLGSIFATAYERARWGRSIDYSAPLNLPPSREDRDWAQSLARSTLTPPAP
jgi:hypothetical protein